MSKRLFAGLELPKVLSVELEKLNPHQKGLQWVPKQNMHITLSFLGNISAEHQEKLEKSLADIKLQEFFLPIATMGVFPAKELPRILWVGVGGGHPSLFLLHKKIQDIVLKIGLEPDLKPFKPHVTVARCKGVSSEFIRQFVKKNRDLDYGLIKVTGFTLYSSNLDPNGAIYHIENRIEWDKPTLKS